MDVLLPVHCHRIISTLNEGLDLKSACHYWSVDSVQSAAKVRIHVPRARSRRVLDYSIARGMHDTQAGHDPTKLYVLRNEVRVRSANSVSAPKCQLEGGTLHSVL